tara:strand:+ start:1533 stop:3035 length:1503 start_codon:yes stop_codon:yes gene_type:complete
MKYQLVEFRIRNYRSISDIKLKIDKANLAVICGSNNVGKTNFLRALNLFFNPKIDNFDADRDVPYHIAEGSRGAGYKTVLTGKFIEKDSGKTLEIKQSFSEKKGIKGIVLEGKKGKDVLSESNIRDFLHSNFSFFFIEASNINIPKLVSEIVNDAILPLGMDKRRGKNQKESLEKLNQFIDLSKSAVKNIEDDLTSIFQNLLKEVDSIDSDNWKLQIKFPEYDFLREAISKIIEFTLYDTNERKLETKGSGIQRIILLSLIQYVNSRTKKDVIWAIDEPEIFLQAGLQKSLYSRLLEESGDSQIIITTHSHFFVNIQNLENTFLFEGTKEIKEYARKEGVLFYKLNTMIYEGSGFQKSQKIKQNFGISKNDSWEVMPFNILVEGQEDKDLLSSLIKSFNLTLPNILVGGGVTKFPGYLRFLEEFCSELEYKPKIIAIFDRDSEGRKVFNSLNDKHYKDIDLSCKYIIRFDGKDYNGIELEDFVYPDILYSLIQIKPIQSY